MSLEPSLSQIRTKKKKQFIPPKDNVIMSTTSPHNRMSTKSSAKFDNGVRSGENTSKMAPGVAVTSMRESKKSPRAKTFVNDSANEVDTMTRKDTDYRTH